RLKFPCLHGFNGLLVQAQAKAAGHMDVARAAIRPHHQHEHANHLIFCLASLFGILGLGIVERPGSGNAATHTKHATPNTAAVTWTHSGPLTRTNAPARTRTDTAARSGSVGGGAGNVRHRAA